VHVTVAVPVLFSQSNLYTDCPNSTLSNWILSDEIDANLL